MSIKFKETKPQAFNKIKRQLRDNYAIAVGFPSSKTGSIAYPNGMKVVQVAAANHFGVPELRIPSRPFMSIAKRPAEKVARPMYKSLEPLIWDGRITQKKIAQLIGVKVTDVFKKVISDLKEPPNAPRTIAKKGFDNPLIDTNLMLRTVTFEVRKIKATEGDV